MTTVAARGPAVRVLVDPQPADGAWNMAVDAVLLESALQHGVCSLRWYRWDAPTLSLGYFQKAVDAQIDARFFQLPQVRRLSGGGAILHDRELTYSCAISPDHPLASQPSGLYEALHRAIVAVLAESGAAVVPRGTTDRALDANFLCFSRGDANDLVLGGHKLLGSAQRRRRGAVLQHGSLLLERSALAPEFPGLFDLCDPHPSLAELQGRLVSATQSVLGVQHAPGFLTLEEESRVRELLLSPVAAKS